MKVKTTAGRVSMPKVCGNPQEGVFKVRMHVFVHAVVVPSNITNKPSSTGQIKQAGSQLEATLGSPRRKWLFPADLCMPALS